MSGSVGSGGSAARRPAGGPRHLVTASFDHKAEADAARVALDAVAGRLGIELRQSPPAADATGARLLTVRGVTPPAMRAVRALIARHHGTVVIDVVESHLRR